MGKITTDRQPFRGLLCAEALSSVHHIILPTSPFERPGNRSSESLSGPRPQSQLARLKLGFSEALPACSAPRRVDAELQIR